MVLAKEAYKGRNYYWYNK